MPRKPINLAVLLSGSGRTLKNILEHIEQGKLDARVVTVVSSKPNVRGLEIAREAGIDAVCIPRKEHPDEEEYSRLINEHLAKYDIDLIVLAGFLSRYIYDPKYEGRIMNIHPALVPSFSGPGWYGEKVHRGVLEYGVKVTGCTVHFVNYEYDRGPVILQKVVPVLDDDTPETLAARVFEKECEAYPEAIQLFAEGRLKIEGRWVRILPPEEEQQ